MVRVNKKNKYIHIYIYLFTIIFMNIYQPKKPPCLIAQQNTVRLAHYQSLVSSKNYLNKKQQHRKSRSIFFCGMVGLTLNYVLFKCV